MNKQCPRCGSGLHPVPVRNSRSRVDDAALICNPCGTSEALFGYFFPDRPLPALTEKIEVNA